MKVLMCNKYHFDHGGAERYLFDLSAGLRDIGCDVVNFSVKDVRNFESEYQEFFIENVNYDKILESGLWTKIKAASGTIYSFEASRKVRLLTRRYRPDIAHIHNIYHQISPSILHVFREEGIPIVMTVHDHKLVCPNYKMFIQGQRCDQCRKKNYYHCFIRRCIKGRWSASLLGMLEAYVHSFLKSYDLVDLFIVPGQFMEDRLVESGINRSKIVFLPHSINLLEFPKEENVGNYIVYAGRLSLAKGVRTLIESLKEFPAIKVKIVGDGPLREELKVFVVKHGLAYVEFLGHQDHSTLSVILRGALCVIVPSEWDEPAGLIIYEAFACGKCIIGSRIGAIPELIRDGVNGILFEAGNSSDLSRKIRYVLTYPDKAKECGENAARDIRQRCDLKKHSVVIKEQYMKLLQSCKEY